LGKLRAVRKLPCSPSPALNSGRMKPNICFWLGGFWNRLHRRALGWRLEFGPFRVIRELELVLKAGPPSLLPRWVPTPCLSPVDVAPVADGNPPRGLSGRDASLRPADVPGTLALAVSVPARKTQRAPLVALQPLFFFQNRVLRGAWGCKASGLKAAAQLAAEVRT